MHDQALQEIREAQSANDRLVQDMHESLNIEIRNLRSAVRHLRVRLTEEEKQRTYEVSSLQEAIRAIEDKNEDAHERIHEDSHLFSLSGTKTPITGIVEEPNLLEDIDIEVLGRSESFDFDPTYNHGRRESFMSRNLPLFIEERTKYLVSTSVKLYHFLIKKIFGFQQPEDEPYCPVNTETFHMYAVHVVTSTNPENNHWLRPCVVAFLSIFLVFAQIYTCVELIDDVGFPQCSVHSDCRDGEFCGTMEKKFTSTVKCTDCDDNLLWKDKNLNSTFCANILELDEANLDIFEVDQEAWYFNRSTELGNDYKYLCSAWAQCENDIFPKQCDFVELLVEKVNTQTWLTLIFISITLACKLSKDCYDAAHEEQLLDFGWNDSIGRNRRKMGFAELLARRSAAEVVRVSLRIRQFALPVYASVASAAVIVNDDINTQNTIFNILSLVLILEVDDEIAGLVLPKQCIPLMNEVAVKAKKSKKNFKDPFLWTRAVGVGSVISMCIIIIYFDNILKSFWGTGKNCDGIGNMFFQTTLSIILLLFFLNLSSYIVGGQMKDGFNQCMQNLTALSTACMAMLLSPFMIEDIMNDRIIEMMFLKESEYLLQIVSGLFLCINYLFMIWSSAVH